MTVYAFEFAWCKYESGYATVSLHSTMKGAFRAMKTDQNRQYIDSLIHHKYGERINPLEHSLWRVKKYEVIE
jgi:hypothetical protein